jgi:hypothetical protein
MWATESTFMYVDQNVPFHLEQNIPAKFFKNENKGLTEIELRYALLGKDLASINY